MAKRAEAYQTGIEEALLEFETSGADNESQVLLRLRKEDEDWEEFTTKEDEERKKRVNEIAMTRVDRIMQNIQPMGNFGDFRWTGRDTQIIQPALLEEYHSESSSEAGEIEATVLEMFMKRLGGFDSVNYYIGYFNKGKRKAILEDADYMLLTGQEYQIFIFGH